MPDDWKELWYGRKKAREEEERRIRVRERFGEDFPWLEQFLPTEPEFPEKPEPEVSPWLKTLAPGLEAVVGTAQIVEEVGKITGSMLAAPFDPVLRRRLTYAPGEFLEPESLARQRYEEEVPSVAKFFAEEAIYIPLYVAGIGVAKKAVENLSVTLLTRVESGLAKVAKDRLPNALERRAMQALRLAGGQAKLSEEALLREAYGVVRVGAKQVAEKAVPAAAPAVAPAAVQAIKLTARQWNKMPVSERVSVATEAGLFGKVGSKAWKDLTKEERGKLIAQWIKRTELKPPEVPAVLDIDAQVKKVFAILDEYTGARWAKPEKGVVGSKQGLLKLPHEARAELYNALVPIVGSERAHILRDWRPTKIKQWVEETVKAIKTTPTVVTAPALRAKLQPTPEDALTRLTTLIAGARPILKEQKYLRTQVLRRRVERYAGMLENAQSYQAAAQARGTLRGEMPSGIFQPPAALGFTKKETNAIVNMVKESQLKPLEKGNVIEALVGKDAKGGIIFAGELPTRYELKLLEQSLGIQLVKELLKRKPWHTKMAEASLDIMNLPRSILASIDLSATLRQGGVLLPAHPKASARAFVDQLRALTSAENSKAMNEVLLGRTGDPLTDAMALRRLRAGLYIADLEGGMTVGAREEAFMSRILQRIAENYGKYRIEQKVIAAPVYPLAQGVRLSERTYVTYLNKLRADVFDGIIAGWERSGKAITSNDELELARFINRATGRGELMPGEYTAGGSIIAQRGGALLNFFFFSPRLQTSRIELPWCLMSTSDLVRKQAAKDLAIAFGAGITVLSLFACHPDVNVELDPRSTDFGKIRVGNTRLDFWAGFQPWVRLFAQTATGERVAASGRTMELNRYENALHFGRGKYNPAFSILVDQLAGRSFVGEEIWRPGDPGELLVQQTLEDLAPMYLQDVKDAIEQEGLLTGLTLTVPAFFGATVSAYDSANQFVAEVRGRYSEYLLVKKDFEELIREGKIDQAQAFSKKHPELRYGAIYGKVSRAIDAIEDRIELIEQMEGITDEEREEKIENLNRTIIELAQTAALQADGLDIE